MSIPLLRALINRWGSSQPAERANAQSYLIELCHALEVEPPRPAGQGYEFEFPVKVVARDGTEQLAACGVLKDLHDELDTLVAQAYGWPWPMEKEEILERLVVLHDERVAEEQAGRVRWLRPDYQIPRFGTDLPAGGELGLPEAHAPESAPAPAPAPWPVTAIEQLGAVKSLFATRVLGSADVIGAFAGADPRLVARHLETLAIMGELIQTHDGRYSLGVGPGTASAA